MATKIGPIPFGVRAEVKEMADEILLKGFVKTEWFCQRIEQYGGVFDTKLLKKIGELTECTLTYNSEARMITVVGPAQEACHHAITKLDKVRDYEVSRPSHVSYQPPLTHLRFPSSTTPTPTKSTSSTPKSTLTTHPSPPPSKKSTTSPSTKTPSWISPPTPPPTLALTTPSHCPVSCAAPSSTISAVPSVLCRCRRSRSPQLRRHRGEGSLRCLRNIGLRGGGNWIRWWEW